MKFSLKINDNNITSTRQLSNAVRRAFASEDVALNPGDEFTVKGVTVIVREAPQARVRNDLSEVRTWAIEQGHTVGKRGRIAAEIREAYAAAHKG